MATTDFIRPGTLLAQRYCVESILGRGGMGSVYRVFDQTSGQRLALKLLDTVRAESSPHLYALFRREYHTLVQLSHPHIVQAFDYGVDRDRPYYTMELLQGGDLREQAPLPWRRVCELLRDIASSLSIIHSRRLVHRDVTPRNVRITPDQRAKLIDFGAMATMGTTGEKLGTPPFVPPEAVYHQPLDGRSDLFALGGLAYWLLTGKHAYPARAIAELKDLWRTPLAPPSSLVPGIPATLDDLVQSLLSLDALARPISASEVIDRLHATAGLCPPENVAEAHAYLTSPSMIGRDDELLRIRKQMLRAVRGRGGCLIIQAAAGMGRTRLLQELAWEAKMAGATVVRASASQADIANYAVARRLAAELLEVAAEQATLHATPWLQHIGHVVPRLHELCGAAAGDEPPVDPTERRMRAQGGLLSWLLAFSHQRPLVLAVDDIEYVDEPSAALLAALAAAAPRAQLVIAVTRAIKVPPRAPEPVERLQDIATTITLGGLSAEQSEMLLERVFGSVPNLRTASAWIHSVAQGNPLQTMQFARDLVERGVFRYQAGAWLLPDHLRDQQLPRTIAEVFDARVRTLGHDARRMAELLVIHGGELEIDEVIELADYDAETAFRALDELVAAEAVVGSGESYQFSQRGLSEAVDRSMSDERRRELHLRMGEALAAKADRIQTGLDAALHLFLGGSPKKGLKLILKLEHITLDGAWAQQFRHHARTLEMALQVCREQQRPPRDENFVGMLLLVLAAHADHKFARHLDPVIDRLRHDAGLVYYEQHTDPTAGSEERIHAALQHAMRVYEKTPYRQRGVYPLTAARRLIVCAGLVCAVEGTALRIGRLKDMPRILEPLNPLNPAVAIWAEICRSAVERLEGRVDRSNERRMDIIEQLDQPSVDAEVGTSIKTATLGILLHLTGLHEARQGGDGALARAEQLQQVAARYEPHAYQVRMLAHLYNGNIEQAEVCRERTEVLAIQAGRRFSELTAIQAVADAHALCGDLIGLRQTIDTMEVITAELPGWSPLLDAARAEYNRQRGEYAQARAGLEHALSHATAGQHAAWPALCTSYATTLVDLGEYEEARTVAEAGIARGKAERLGRELVRRLGAVLAMAEAHLGYHAAASHRLERIVREARRQGVAGVPMGVLHESRARVGLLAGEVKLFEREARKAADYLRPGRHPALAAKYKRLVEEARKRTLHVADDIAHAARLMTRHSNETNVEATITTLFDSSSGRPQRARRAVELIAKRCQTEEAYLYLMQEGGVVQVAATKNHPAPEELQALVDEYMAAEVEHTTALTTTGLTSLSQTGCETDHPAYHPLLLRTSHDGHLVVVGLAVVRADHRSFEVPPAELLRAMATRLLAMGDAAAVAAAR